MSGSAIHPDQAADTAVAVHVTVLHRLFLVAGSCPGPAHAISLELVRWFPDSVSSSRGHEVPLISACSPDMRHRKTHDEYNMRVIEIGCVVIVCQELGLRFHGFHGGRKKRVRGPLGGLLRRSCGIVQGAVIGMD